MVLQLCFLIYRLLRLPDTAVELLYGASGGVGANGGIVGVAQLLPELLDVAAHRNAEVRRMVGE